MVEYFIIIWIRGGIRWSEMINIQYISGSEWGIEKLKFRQELIFKKNVGRIQRRSQQVWYEIWRFRLLRKFYFNSYRFRLHEFTQLLSE